MRRPMQHGFTLIEMLVALALMGMIAVILITSLQIGGHTWQRVMRTSGGTADIAQVQEILRLRLSALYPENRTGNGSLGAFLVSDGSSLKFLGEGPQANAEGMLRYQVAISSSSGSLEIRSWPDRQGPGVTPGGSQGEALLTHVASLAVQFWIKPETGAGRWVDRWESDQLPRLIRIDVGFGANDKRRWPPLYIEPRIDTPASCAFDVVSRRCRSGA